MLRRLATLVRALALAVALFQASAPAVAALGEGALASRGGRGVAATHVEDSRQATCPFAHEVDRALCAYASLLSGPEAGHSPLGDASRARATSGCAPTLAERRGVRALPPVRAPPRR